MVDEWVVTLRVDDPLYLLEQLIARYDHVMLVYYKRKLFKVAFSRTESKLRRDRHQVRCA